MKRILLFGLVAVLLLSGCGVSTADDATRITSTEETPKVTSATEPSLTEEQSDYRLGEMAKPYNIRIGAAVEPHYLLEEDYAKIVKDQFSVLTPENRMKWGFIHPSKDTYSFEEADQIVDFAIENDMDIRGHALVWHIENPDWLEDGDWTRDELLAILEDHIKTVVGHYKGKVYAWDVVNEVVEWNDYRHTLWYDVIGPEYIEYAFRWAHEADPDAKLFINDYQIEEQGMKSDMIYDIVSDFIDRGVPIDGVGFQFHVDMSDPFDLKRVYANLKRFDDLGLMMDFTEIDARMKLPSNEFSIEEQSAMYKSLMEIALNFDSITSYTMWGFTDKYSWIPGFFNGQGEGLIFDETYQPKENYYAIIEALEAGIVKLPYEDMLDMSKRISMSPYIAKIADKAPIIDGVESEGEWANGVWYNFTYNQLDKLDQTAPYNKNDIYGDFTVLHHEGVLYGIVHRVDNLTITSINGETYKNDNVEVFIGDNSFFQQLRSIVGQDFEDVMFDYEHKGVWNEDGSVFEFMIQLPESNMDGLTMDFNIALADSDDNSSGRKYQLYPISGHNVNYLGNDLGLLAFEGTSPRPVSYEQAIPPLEINQTIVEPKIDGEHSDFEWTESTLYPFAYDLLSEKQKGALMIDSADIYGNFRIGHSENQIYGIVEIKDDVLQVTDDVYTSDAMILNFNFGNTPITLESMVGDNQTIEKDGVSYTTHWNESGTNFEFMIDFSQVNDTTLIESFFAPISIHSVNILLLDSDAEGELSHVLSPFNGTLVTSDNLADVRGEMEIQ